MGAPWAVASQCYLQPLLNSLFFLIEVLSYPSSKAYFRAAQQRLLDGHFMLKHALWHRPCGQGSGVIPQVTLSNVGNGRL